jgi:hypothetical protein
MVTWLLARGRNSGIALDGNRLDTRKVQAKYSFD